MLVADTFSTRTKVLQNSNKSWTGHFKSFPLGAKTSSNTEKLQTLTYFLQSFWVVSGTTDNTDKNGTISYVKNVSVHPKYQSLLYDFAILELTKPLDLGPKSHARKVCLPSLEDVNFNDKNTSFIESGWGQTGWNGTSALTTKKLKDIDVNWISMDECIQMYNDSSIPPPELDIISNYLIKNSDVTICVNFVSLSKNYTGACFGDSGGNEKSFTSFGAK